MKMEPILLQGRGMMLKGIKLVEIKWLYLNMVVNPPSI
jgi:hypothetical protein